MSQLVKIDEQVFVEVCQFVFLKAFKREEIEILLTDRDSIDRLLNALKVCLFRSERSLDAK